MNISSQEPFVRAARKLLGEYGCYPLMAIEKLKTKNAWQMYASNNNIAPSVANAVSKFIDNYEEDMKHASDEEKEDIHIEDYIPNEYVDIFNGSKDYRGITSNLKVHACGHILLNGDIRREIGLVSAVSKTTGKRVVCAAMEGGYLDEYGYVKEDFLIVDAVGLTYKFFKSIGQDIPTFTELHKMVDGDKATWNIYAIGATCCVNQCEKPSTILKVKKYKPQNISELSQFVAGIRPGFASLLSNFLARKPYSTGEPGIDNLLEDSSHYMLYQESIMKVLNYLGLPMGSCYQVIKKISKKKLKGEYKENLLKTLKDSWLNKFGNLNNFDKVWKVISDAARYSFNAPHAMSMAGDSLYQAWFKAHHTKKFYEVAIKHYQEKGNKNKIDALVKEAIKFFGYRLGDYKFGDDNRVIHLNEKEKIIYPNISSIKGLGDKVGEDLYILGQNKYNSFLDVIKALYESGINQKIISSLIRIGYFKDYGHIPKLLEIKRYFDFLKRGEAKSLSKDKAEENGLSFEILRKYSTESAKQFNKLDCSGLLNELSSNIKDTPEDIYDVLHDENKILGVCRATDSTADPHVFFIQTLDIGKSTANITAYSVNKGRTCSFKMWSRFAYDSFDQQKIHENDVIFVTKYERKNQKEWRGKLKPNGKRLYEDIPDKFENWLTGWNILKTFSDENNTN